MKIGIIGGNSQVGSSVAYYFKKYTDVDVICFVRSSYSKIFFELHKIPFNSIDLNNKADLKEKLKDCNAVIDFTLPSGELYSISKTIDEILENIISGLSEKQVYIYMSSIMAYGMPPREKNIKSYFLPQSSYAFIKRKAEKKCLQWGKKYGVKTYNFRLGQVHGFLQSVNSSFREKLTQNPVAYFDGNESDVTNTVFINSIAESIIRFSKGNENQGTYTLISNPQWTLKQLYEFYIEFYGIPVTLKFIPKPENKRNLRNSILSILKKYRPILETYILMKLPSLSFKVKGKYRENEIRLLKNERVSNPEYIDYNLLGKPDRQIIDEVNTDYSIVFNLEKDMEKNYLNVLNLNRV